MLISPSKSVGVIIAAALLSLSCNGSKKSTASIAAKPNVIYILADDLGSPLTQGFDHFYGFTDQVLAHNYYPEYLWSQDKKVKSL
ncbi:hypothetical protein FFWV33_17995 [Flavobacterium faecale]|uniref:Sulfatase N-terminal domain-containing protein n=1 Tax=Flavobacterium faecale TaxID=1355330 RepID=A0A2S1LHQ5_9FLAO|nr:hypothetical protein [Flavobacterium faecale]AWG23283.1 hypothetical protein FFWV33_17995 [Flavobacterium faecale]